MSVLLFFPLWLYSPIWALVTSMTLSVSLQLLDLGQLVGSLGQVISSSQGLYLCINTEKRTHNTNTKQSMPKARFEPTIIASEQENTVMP
jgi:folate-dependent tRNA-U54 methylase TrmFO/GidA